MEVLSGGSAREPAAARPGPPVAAVALGALLVLLGGLAAVRAQPPAEPVPALTAEASGTSAVNGRLRTYLVLRGEPGAVLSVTGVRLPGLRTGVDAPAALDGTGTAAVRLDVQPGCPDGGGDALAGAALRVRSAGRDSLVPFPTAGVLEDVVRARCAGRLGAAESDVRPALLPGDGGGPGVRAVLLLATDGAAPLRVDAVRPGPGLALAGTAPGPLVVAPRDVRPVVLDLLPGRCAAEPGAPLLLLDAGGSATEPRVDRGLRAQLDALRLAACRGAR